MNAKSISALDIQTKDAQTIVKQLLTHPQFFDTAEVQAELKSIKAESESDLLEIVNKHYSAILKSAELLLHFPVEEKEKLQQELASISKSLRQSYVIPMQQLRKNLEEQRILDQEENKISKMQLIQKYLIRAKATIDQKGNIFNPISLSFVMREFTLCESLLQFQEIEEIKEDIAWLSESRKRLETIAKNGFLTKFRTGKISKKSEPDQEIQILFNLGSLKNIVQDLVNKSLKEINASWRQLLQELSKCDNFTKLDSEEKQKLDSVEHLFQRLISDVATIYNLALQLQYDVIRRECTATNKRLQNLFSIYFEKLMQVMRSTLNKFRKAEVFTKMLDFWSKKDQEFALCVDKIWGKVVGKYEEDEKLRSVKETILNLIH